MKLNYYIKTEEKKHIDNFIKICKECNIPLDLDDDLYEDEIIGVGIFMRSPEITIENSNVNDIKLYPMVCLVSEIGSKWEKGSLMTYESHIREFDLNKIKSFLYDKLLECKKKFPEIKIGCHMTDELDKKSSKFSKDLGLSRKFILKAYRYCVIDEQWAPRTDRGYGDFDGFRVIN